EARATNASQPVARALPALTTSSITEVKRSEPDPRILTDRESIGTARGDCAAFPAAGDVRGGRAGLDRGCRWPARAAGGAWRRWRPTPCRPPARRRRYAAHPPRGATCPTGIHAAAHAR